MKCEYCGNPRMERHERNTKSVAEVLYICQDCGASTKRLGVSNPYRAEAQPFSEPPAVGEWTR